jgi:YebC/PmpR family DNA-binding regulatory protein
MAGHSKWANIKRQKARVDSVKGKVSAKISRELIVAARGGADPAGNFQLRTAIQKAKAAGMPNDTIERSIAKGAGVFDSGSQLEYIRYEGYGVGGVAVLIEALTDNRNRTAADLRESFRKSGGNLGETGCVGWMFDQEGVITIKGKVNEDDLLDALLEGDAQHYELIEIDEDIPGVDVFTTPYNLENLSKILQDRGYETLRAESRWIPNNTIELVDRDQAKLILKLMDALEDLDDVQNVAANFEMSDDIMSAIMG